MKKKELKKFSTSLSPRLIKRIKKKAIDEGVKIYTLVTMMVEDWLEKDS